MWWDVVGALLGLATIAYLLTGGDDVWDRSVTPTPSDTFFGVVFVLCVLEACRRTSGLILTGVVLAFVGYAFAGPWLPGQWAHRGYDVASLTGFLYQTLEGIFGTAVDVSSSLIILFTIYGAFLQHSGAGKFFLDWSFAAMGGKHTSAGRTVVLSSFLLGGPSGSGVATTVTIGSVAWPMLERAGYSKNAAGGLLAAGGLGAIISPPVLGAAAFLIAEFLKISYLDVIMMAVVPTLLYYLSLLVMVELDVRRFGMSGVVAAKVQSLWALTRRHGYHFVSLVAIRRVPAARLLAGAVGVLGDRRHVRDELPRPPRRAVPAAAGRGAARRFRADAQRRDDLRGAGIIVGVVAKTGLGLKFSAIVIAYAGGSLLLTALYTALIVWIIGLAVPVTASYIICAVIAAPALTKLGVPDFAAHMFIFYYAVLSEVSPPTALSPFAAAAITGGDPYKTTLQSWKYTLPAFVVPFVFVLSPDGVGLLLKTPPEGSWAGRGVDRRHRARRHRGARVRRAGLAARQARGLRARRADPRGPGARLPGVVERHRGARRHRRGRRVALAGQAAQAGLTCAASTRCSRATASRTAIRATRRSTGSACRSSPGACSRSCGGSRPPRRTS
jgi:TRAP transporter 4TM/12TM fusion protein